MMRLVLLLLIASCLTSCTPQKAADDGRVTITYSCGPDRNNGLHRRIQVFEHLNPGIHVNLLELPSSTDTEHNQYATYLIAEDPTIDVYALDVIWPSEFGSAGWALPLEDKLPPEEWAKFLPGPLAACRYQGHTWAIPWYTDAGMLYYRKDLIEEAHLKVPQTWDELVQVAQKLQTSDRYGYVGQWRQYEGLVCNITEFLWGNGGDILDPSGKVVMDSPQNAEALQFMADMMYKHKIAPEGLLTYDEDQCLKTFMSGKAVFMRNWPYAWALCDASPSSKVNGKVGVAPLPHGPHGQSAATLGGWNLMVSAYSLHPQEAWKWVKFLTDSESQKRLAFDSSILPTRTDVYQDPEVLEKLPVMAQFYEVFKGARPRPVTPYYSQVSDVLQATLDPALTGKMPPDAALKHAQEDIGNIRGFAGR